MKKKILTLCVLVVIILLLGTGCKKRKEITYRTFAEITDIEAFQTVPYLETMRKILFLGDSADDGTDQVLKLYDSSYFNLDIYIPSHHGINVYDRFTNICTYDVILYGSFRAGSIWDSRASLAAAGPNNRLKAEAKEVFHHGDGTVSLTLPYEIGTAAIGEDMQDYYKPW